MNVEVDIKNCPEYAKEHKYIVATVVDGDLWFYESTDDYTKAVDMQDGMETRVIIRYYNAR